MHSSFRPINNFILVKQLQAVRLGSIELPDIAQHLVNLFIGVILEVGNKVEDSTIIQYRICYFDKKKAVLDFKDGRFLFKEDSILLIKDKDGVFRPLGDRVLIERNISEQIKLTPGSNLGYIITGADCYRTTDQSLFGTVYRYGIKDGEIRESAISVGDKIKILRWDASIHEIGDMDGRYLLSVPRKLLQYKQEENVE